MREERIDFGVHQGLDVLLIEVQAPAITVGPLQFEQRDVEGQFRAHRRPRTEAFAVRPNNARPE